MAVRAVITTTESFLPSKLSEANGKHSDLPNPVGRMALPFKELVTAFNCCAFNFLYPNHSAVLTANSCSIFIP